MNKKVKCMAAVLAAITMGGLMASCSGTTNNAGESAGTEKKEKIAVIQLVENGAFNDMRDGFIAGMKEDGYTDDNFQLYNANGDQSTLATIVQDAITAKSDLIVTVATPATAAVVAADTDIPNMFIAVSDPIGNSIISDWDVIDHNSTGTSNPVPADKIFELADQLTPGYTKVGMMCNPAEKNAVSTCKAAAEYLDSKNIEYIQKDVTSPATDALTAVAALIEAKVDIIFIPNDSSLQSYMESISGAATDAGIPTYGSSSVMPSTGALGAVAISDFNIGKKTAEMAKQLFAGEDIKNIPSVAVEADETSINYTTAEKLGITVPNTVQVDIKY